jgi:hypothetical protein
MGLPYNNVIPNGTVIKKLLVPQLVKKLRVFYGTGKFITVFTTALHLSLF